MSRAVWVVIALVLIGIAAALWFFMRGVERPPLPPPAAPVPAPQKLPEAKAPQYPVPVPPPLPEEKPLPPLKESDPTLLESLSGLLGSKQLGEYVRPESLVRHIVVTIDNLPRKTFASELSPVQPPRGSMQTTGKGESLAISPENAARYTPYVRLFESIDTKKMVSTYVRFYPLFQQAYVDLGFPGRYFNDRLIEVIDHMLATPDVKLPIKLTVRHVLPEFADPELEKLSAGQKLMLRMGTENAGRVKAKLRALRAELVKLSK